MAVGDQNDFIGRLRSALPSRWFPITAPGAASATPLLDGILAGLASTWSWFYGLVVYTNLQTRISTSTDVWLDLISQDFFGYGMPRQTQESDAQYRARLLAAILRPRSTRAALAAALVSLTGRTPTIFEPANTSDTGGYNLGCMGYGMAGGYGDLNLPFQAFVTAYRHSGGGVANVAGYGDTTPAVSNVITSTSGGSVADGSGNVYTMVSGSIYMNGTVVPGSAGTAKITVQGGVIWAYAAPTGPWYTLVAGVFTAQSGAPVQFNAMPGGYGSGAIEYASQSFVNGQITDAMIQAAVANVIPEATTAWLRISN